jgi:hypothetical protein
MRVTIPALLLIFKADLSVNAKKAKPLDQLLPLFIVLKLLKRLRYANCAKVIESKFLKRLR